MLQEGEKERFLNFSHFQTPEINCLSDGGLRPTELNGKITFEDVHFVYPTRQESKVSEKLLLHPEKCFKCWHDECSVPSGF